MFVETTFIVRKTLKELLFEEFSLLEKMYSTETNKHFFSVNHILDLVRYITRSKKGNYTINFTNPERIIVSFSGRRSSLLKGTDIGFNLRLPRYTAIKHLTGANAQFIIKTVDRHTIILDGEITFIESTAMNKPLM